ncbi:immobilization antigen (macronuclear) [Tetrahymena thermophila SB210]|uniref:Immobilization antigen n=1 Tax=Tetrahymena thermophila (strain SB210) TaxID=312017 RepID=Q22C91_TETTS|nr:immobilization antigen [Tetrahymena thermophila SB210]EAR82916.1 immobilization antigen [Tetrahymena thermophila SB210]|eukprot:XP_001030579.1 immobilization antigen [Tetrahymena thermophila SB210]
MIGNRFLTILFVVILFHQANAQCGTNASKVGSTCYCNPGYYGPNDSNCQQCQSNTYSLQGVSNTGPSVTQFSACSYCQIGYYVTTPGTATALPGCLQCPAGSTTLNPLSQPGSISSCICFDPNGTALSSLSQACQCNIGFYGSPQTTQAGPSGCTPCPANFTSPIGTADQTGCTKQLDSSILKAFQQLIMILILF